MANDRWKIKFRDGTEVDARGSCRRVAENNASSDTGKSRAEIAKCRPVGGELVPHHRNRHLKGNCIVC